MIFWLFFNLFFSFFFFQAQQRRPLPIGAGTIRQPNESDNNTPNLLQTAPSPSGGTSTPTLTQGAAGAAAPPSNRHKNVAWIENQIRKDQHEAVNPKYKLPFKSKDDAIKRLLRYKIIELFKGGLISKCIFTLSASSKNVPNHYPQLFSLNLG